jgi:hypothetical protein
VKKCFNDIKKSSQLLRELVVGSFSPSSRILNHDDKSTTMKTVTTYIQVKMSRALFKEGAEFPPAPAHSYSRYRYFLVTVTGQGELPARIQGYKRTQG